MNELEISNLKEIIKLNYPNICINYDDARQIIRVPSIKKDFYSCHGSAIAKAGFLNKGKTLLWYDWVIEPGYIKIATQLPLNVKEGWSELLSFQEEGSPLKIYKLIKMKAFW